MGVCVGLDPGKEGFVSWIDSATGRHVGSQEQPLIGKGKGDTFDKSAMVRLVRSVLDLGIDGWAIELQSAGGKARGGGQAFFSKGLGYGLWLGVLAALEVPVMEVDSREWRKEFNCPQPRYPKEPAPEFAGKRKLTPEQAAVVKAWGKREAARLTRQRNEGLAAAVRAAQALHPGVDMRRNANCKTPSADKAVSLLLASYALRKVRS